MSDTPETDDIARGNHVVPTEWAQQLERERDEAREDLEHWKIEYEIVVSRLCGIKHERDNGIIAENEIIPVLRKERDEAVEEIKEWETLCLWGGTPEHIHGFIGGQQSRIQHLECERDEARDILQAVIKTGKRLERERDEARELLASEKITRNHIIKRSVEVERERDEAREDLKHITEYGTEEINAAVELRQKLATALVERDEWAAMCGTYKQERDKAREALAKILKNE